MIQRLFPVVLILVGIGLFFMYTSPTWSGPVAEHKAMIKSYDSALSAAREFQAKEASLELERQALPREGLERLEALLPNNVNNIQLILDLDALAARAGVQLSDFSITEGTTGETQAVQPGAAVGGPGPSVPGGIEDVSMPQSGLQLESTSPIDSLEITVTAVGNYTAFRNFLDSAERRLRLLDVVGLTISNDATGVYTYDITFRIYWLR